jgi:hypothetical protein
MFPIEKFSKSHDELKANVENPEVFWKLASEFLEFSKGEHYLEAFDSMEREKHPAIIQEFISNPEAKEYYVREGLLDIIKKL